jgi:hypothetical protein
MQKIVIDTLDEGQSIELSVIHDQKYNSPVIYIANSNDDEGAIFSFALEINVLIDAITYLQEINK